MSGLAHANRSAAEPCQERFFGADLISTAFGVSASGAPLLCFGLGCGSERVEEHTWRLRGAMLLISSSEDTIAFDIVGGRGPQRVGTSEGLPYLPLVVAHLHAFNCHELQIALHSVEDLSCLPPDPVSLPVRYERVLVTALDAAM